MSAHTLQKGELEPTADQQRNIQSGANLNRSGIMPYAVNNRSIGSNRVSYKDMVNVQMRMRRMRTSTNVLVSPRGEINATDIFTMSNRTSGRSDALVQAAYGKKHPHMTLPNGSSAGLITPTYASNDFVNNPL